MEEIIAGSKESALKAEPKSALGRLNNQSNDRLVLTAEKLLHK